MYGTKCCATLDAAEQCFHTRALVRACTIAAPIRPPCMRSYSLLNHSPKVPWMAQNRPFVLRECRTRLIAVLYVHTFFTCFGCLLTPYTHASPPPYAGSDPFETFSHGFGIPKRRERYLGGAKRTVGDRDLTMGSSKCCAVVWLRTSGAWEFIFAWFAMLCTSGWSKTGILAHGHRTG